jgi:thioredoxin 1
MNLMHGSVVELNRSDLDEHVNAPGISVVNWREHGKLESYGLDGIVERAAQEYPEVRFGTVDVAGEQRLAEQWGVDDVPTLMIFRDGTFLYSSSGDLAAGALESLLDAAMSMDMGAARKGVNGHHGRFVLGFHTGSGSAAGAWDAAPGVRPAANGDDG